MSALPMSDPRQLAAAPGQSLTFLLGAAMFAIGILVVKEIIEYHGVTPVPQMPPCISGVINLRGAAVPVLNLARRLDREPGPVTKRTCIIVLEIARDEGAFVIGVRVDAVNAVIEIPAADIEPAPTFGSAVRAELLQGIGKVQERFVLLLNVQHVVSAQEIAAFDRVDAPPAAAADAS